MLQFVTLFSELLAIFLLPFEDICNEVAKSQTLNLIFWLQGFGGKELTPQLNAEIFVLLPGVRFPLQMPTI